MLSPRHTHRDPSDRSGSLIEIDGLEVPAIETELFLRDHVPRAAQMLEVGAGAGRLAARLARAGWDVTAIDRVPAATLATTRSLVVQCADLADYSGGPFDVVLFSRSLHHMPLEQAIDRAAGLLKPDGLLVLEEFDYERMDDVTAKWLDHEHLAFRDNGWAHDVPEGCGVTDPLERWMRHHRDEHRVHSGADLARAVAVRFEMRYVERPAYLYRYVCRHLAGDRASIVAARSLVAREESWIYTGALSAVGFRLIARLRPDDVRA